MSIISEALKKAQSKRTEELVLRSGDDGSVILQSRTTPHSTKSRQPRIILYVAIVLAVFILAGAALLYWNQHSIKSDPNEFISEIKKTEKPGKQSIGFSSSTIHKNTTKSPPVVPPIVAKIVPKKGPTLEGIMYSPLRPQAILNGRIVSIGDAIDGFTVVGILPDMVTLKSGEETLTLRIR
jgi:hypothetical protein